jgi:cbb3-type cytochrome oxidase maturation protein
MNILLILIPLTLLGLLVAVAMFFWAVNHQQFDDLDNPGVVPLLEDSEHGEPPDDPANPDAINDSTTHDPK